MIRIEKHIDNLYCLFYCENKAVYNIYGIDWDMADYIPICHPHACILSSDLADYIR